MCQSEGAHRKRMELALEQNHNRGLIKVGARSRRMVARSQQANMTSLVESEPSTRVSVRT